MMINMIPIEEALPIVENGEIVLFEAGKYLVRTESTHAKRVQFLEARCTNVWNNKTGRYELSIDVSNQRVTHISILPL
jgi:hypothetical protein